MADTAKKTEVRDLKPVQTETATTSLRRVDPFSEMERLFDDVFSWRRARPSRWGLNFPTVSELAEKVPRIDIVERDNELLVRAELPGVEKDKLDISLTDDTVTIKATTEHEQKKEQGNYYCCEISRGEFARTLTLPAAVNTNQAKASFKNGILELTLPRREQTNRRNIKVE